jgi:hypothetical protein
MLKDQWPLLPVGEWKDIYQTLHMWTQIVGKIRLALTPMENHWWNSTLYITPTGLTTSTIYYKDRLLKIDFDFDSHLLLITTSDDQRKEIPLKSFPVAEFYKEVMNALDEFKINVSIGTTPVEVEERIPFEKDYKHCTYDPIYAHRFWQIVSQSARVFIYFRSMFIGKVSPVHFFWGAFDLAVTRFSGRGAPAHPGVPDCARFVMVEAYSHELSSCGFWPGAEGAGGKSAAIEPLYYSYAYSEPYGFRDFAISPKEAFYDSKLHEFILPYEAVQKSDAPDSLLMDFLQSTYKAAAVTAKWDRSKLERQQSF